MTKSNFTKIIDPINLERELDGYLKKATSKESNLNWVSLNKRH